MYKKGAQQTTARRRFIGMLAAGATALGVDTILFPMQLKAKTYSLEGELNEADEWFAKIQGKHRIVFDVTQPHEVMPFAWPKIFLLTNDKTGTSEKDCGVVVVLRHNAIPYAFNSQLWSDYKFGEMFKADDPISKTPAMRNPFWKPRSGDFKIPGIGEVQIGINELQASGVLFCVCNVSMTAHMAIVAEKMKKDIEQVKKEWLSSLLPGVQLVPSGVWALGRAQEHGCAYCFAG